jgi:hypothetical protein
MSMTIDELVEDRLVWLRRAGVVFPAAELGGRHLGNSTARDVLHLQQIDDM